MKAKSERQGKTRRRLIKRLPTIVAIVVCVLLAPILVINLTIIIKSYANPDKVPDFFGIKLIVVQADSMAPELNEDDLVICKIVDPATLMVGDVISFRPDAAKNDIVTHRIANIVQKDGQPAFVTKGDGNKNDDVGAVCYSQVEGVKVFSATGAGGLMIFMQTPVGMLVFIGIPLLGFILYDILRGRLASKSRVKSGDHLADDKLNDIGS
jgi:signal peptidase